MPLTRFPNGVTVCSTTALQHSASATDGDLDCNRLFVAGAASIGTTLTAGTLAMAAQGTGGSGMVGSREVLSGTFTSAAATTWLATPFAGNIVDVITTCDTTPRTCSALTIQHGTAGSIAVASVALAFATAIGQQIRPTLTSIAVTTASGIAVIVTTAGSAAIFSYSIVLEKTA